MSDYEKLKRRVLEFEEWLRGNDRAGGGQFDTLVHDLWNEIEWLRSRLGAISDSESGRSWAPEEFSDMTFRDFSRANRKRCEAGNGFNHRLDAWTSSDWMTAVMGELGEAANIVKKLNRVRDCIPGNKETEKELKNKLYQELGDTFVYLDLLSQSLAFNIGEAACVVFKNKSIQIGYPLVDKI
jgi:NTP pyrophosphatase (non-canonical NTP hydrolase)